MAKVATKLSSPGCCPSVLAAPLDEDSARCFGQARTLLTVLLTERTCPEFLTLPAYLRHMTGGKLAPVPALPV